MTDKEQEARRALVEVERKAEALAQEVEANDGHPTIVAFLRNFEVARLAEVRWDYLPDQTMISSRALTLYDQYKDAHRKLATALSSSAF